ncbi:MAG TPA: sigma-70 family RNA polymerase sigma factor [Polyangiaceae bacterium]|jgi:DNA-directed RNA polymerase specialized sigma24 family protein|nr:sigma-70 family RNA polymerase sigma factor [Polyangiaceae bacterium]
MSESTDKDAAPSLEDEASDIPDAPLSGVRTSEAVTPAKLRALLALPATQKRIRQIVNARLRGELAANGRDDIAQDVNVAILSSKSLPRTMATVQGWLAIITARAVVTYLRKCGMDDKWLARDAQVEELPPEGESEASLAPDWLLTTWLAPRIAGDARLEQTYEMLRRKAETGKTLAEIAAEHGMTEGALKSRIHVLKTKYEPHWKRRERMLLILLLFAVATIAAIVWLLWPPDKPRAHDRGSSTPNLDSVIGGEDWVSHPPPPSGDSRDR